jgi:hypothetical protein
MRIVFLCSVDNTELYRDGLYSREISQNLFFCLRRVMVRRTKHSTNTTLCRASPCSGRVAVHCYALLCGSGEQKSRHHGSFIWVDVDISDNVALSCGRRVAMRRDAALRFLELVLERDCLIADRFRQLFGRWAKRLSMTFESSRAAAEVAVILANHRMRAKLLSVSQGRRTVPYGLSLARDWRWIVRREQPRHTPK